MQLRDALRSVRGASDDGERPEPGTVLENPATGERIAFRRRFDAAADAPLRFDYYLEPGGFAVGKVDHVHPVQEERFDVRAGRLGVRIDGDEWTATAGTRFAVLPGTPHTVWNDGDREVHAVIKFAPALDSAAFFETTFGLASAGSVTRWGIPGLLQSAVLLDEFRDEFAFAGVPIPVQRSLAAAIAPIGRRAGHRARYPRYRTPETV